MIMSYEERLKVPLVKTILDLYTKSGSHIAIGYERIVIGGRGPYVEFSEEQLVLDELFIPEDQRWRLQHEIGYYYEYRTRIDNVKVYRQKKVVDYADYLIGMWYISPFDLKRQDGEELIVSLKKKKK